MQEVLEAPVPAASPITDARLQEAFEYWRGKAAGRPMPCRADIDPTEIPRLLPHVMLVDVLDGGRYRYRLIGTENASAHGFEATGRYLDEVLPGSEYKAHVLGLYDESDVLHSSRYCTRRASRARGADIGKPDVVAGDCIHPFTVEVCRRFTIANTAAARTAV